MAGLDFWLEAPKQWFLRMRSEIFQRLAYVLWIRARFYPLYPFVVTEYDGDGTF